jgi:hypothetical protein
MAFLSIITFACQGLGPAVMKVGHRTLISCESAAEWRRAREAAACRNA